jgi:hypothetical protein
MATHRSPERGEQRVASASERAPYEAPAVRVFTEEEILAQLGPGQLYTGALPFQF